MEANLVTHALTKCHNSSEDGTGCGTPLVFQQNTRDEVRLFGGDGQTAGALAAEPGMKQQNYVAMAIPILEATSRQGKNTECGDGIGKDGDPMYTLQSSQQNGIATMSQVRRLTPRECERLQGFPDDYTLIQVRRLATKRTTKTKWASDGPRYKALGNSMAVPVMRWIGERINLVENL